MFGNIAAAGALSLWDPEANPQFDYAPTEVPSPDAMVDEIEFIEAGVNRVHAQVVSPLMRGEVTNSNIVFDSALGIVYTFAIPNANADKVEFSVKEEGILRLVPEATITGFSGQTSVTLNSKAILDEDALLPLGSFTIVATFFDVSGAELDFFNLELEVIQLVELGAIVAGDPNVQLKDTFLYGEDVSLVVMLNDTGPLSLSVDYIDLVLGEHYIGEDPPFHTFDNTTPGLLNFSVDASDFGLPTGTLPAGIYTLHADARIGTDVTYSNVLTFEVLEEPATPITTYLVGFDSNYHAAIGDVDSNGFIDVVVRRPFEAGVSPGVTEFVLRNDGNQLINDSMTSSESITAATFPVLSNINYVLGDFNADGVGDLLLEGLESEITEAVDTILFSGEESGTLPMAIKLVDQDFLDFFTHFNEYLKDKNYFASNAQTTVPRTTDYIFRDVLWFCSAPGGSGGIEDFEGILSIVNPIIQITGSIDSFYDARERLGVLCAINGLSVPTIIEQVTIQVVGEEIPENLEEEFPPLTQEIVDAFEETIGNGRIRIEDAASTIVVRALETILGVEIFGGSVGSGGVSDEDLDRNRFFSLLKIASTIAESDVPALISDNLAVLSAVSHCQYYERSECSQVEDWGRSTAVNINGVPLVSPTSGLKSAIYNDIGINRELVAFTGTEKDSGIREATRDAITSVANAFFDSGQQFDEARDIALLADSIFNTTNYKVLFVGHSLGGGLASTAAVHLGPATAEAVTFNSSGIHLEPNEDDSQIIAVYSTNDVLSLIQDNSRLRSVIPILSSANAIREIPSAAGLRLPVPNGGTHFIYDLCLALSDRDFSLCTVTD